MVERADNNGINFGEFDEQYQDNGININFVTLFKRILASWKLILICAFTASLVGVGIGFSIPKTYTSTTIVAPELTTRTNAGGLASLANLAGININTVSVTDAMHPDMYPAIVNSTDFIVSLFDMPVEIDTKEGKVQTDLYDYMVNYCKSPWWTPVLGFPMMLKDKIVSLFKSEDEFENAEGHAEINPLRLTRQQEGVVKAIKKAISVDVAKRTYLLTIKTSMQDSMVAAMLANTVVENLQRFIIDYRTERTRLSVEYYKKMVEEAREDYYVAQRAYANYVDSHQEILGKRYLIESQRLQNEANLRSQMYNAMSQSLLHAEAKVQLETPVLVVIQKGIASHIGKPSKVRYAMLFFMLGAFAASVYVVLKGSYNKI